MNNITLIIILGLYFGFLGALVVFFFIWYKKNNIQLSYDNIRDSVLYNDIYRGRFVDGKFYTIRQFITKPSLFFRKAAVSKFPDMKYDQIKKYIMTLNAKPIIQPTKLLNIMKTKQDKIIPWKPKLKFREDNIINNLRIVKLRKLRKELWLSTDNTTRADLLYKLALPFGIIILAICCLIFFPKIYDKIMSYSNNALQTAASSWVDQLKNIKTMG